MSQETLIKNKKELNKEKCYRFPNTFQNGRYLGKFLAYTYNDEGEFLQFEINKEYIRLSTFEAQGVIATECRQAEAIPAPAAPAAPAMCYQTYNGVYLGQLIKEHSALLTNGQLIPVLQHEHHYLVGPEWKQGIWNGYQYLPAVHLVGCQSRGGKQKTRLSKTRRLRKH
jgi:hypothetical protein